MKEWHQQINNDHAKRQKFENKLKKIQQQKKTTTKQETLNDYIN